MAKKKVKRKSAQSMVDKLASRTLTPQAQAGSTDFRGSSVVAPEGEIQRAQTANPLAPMREPSQGGNIETIIDPATGQELSLVSVGDPNRLSGKKKVKRRTKRQEMEAQTEESALMMLEARRLEEERRLGRRMDGAFRGL